MRRSLPLALIALLVALPGGVAAEEPPVGSIARSFTTPLVVYRAPGGALLRSFPSYSSLSGEPTGLLVVGHAIDAAGVGWLQVRLPLRPNTATGWLREADVEIEPAASRITIDRSARTLVLTQGDTVTLRTRVVVGRSGTPTPLGRFAVWDVIYAPDELVGPWVLTLTAHSPTLTTFSGGDARVAIHGMNGPLRVPVGSAVSNGCVRVPPAAIKKIAAQMSSGIPVTITA